MQSLKMLSRSTMLELLVFLMVKRRNKNLKLNKVQFKIILKETSKKLTKLRDFTLWSVTLAFTEIIRGASIRHGEFTRGGRLIQNSHLEGGVYLSGRLLDH